MVKCGSWIFPAYFARSLSISSFWMKAVSAWRCCASAPSAQNHADLCIHQQCHDEGHVKRCDGWVNDERRVSKTAISPFLIGWEIKRERRSWNNVKFWKLSRYSKGGDSSQILQLWMDGLQTDSHNVQQTHSFREFCFDSQGLKLLRIKASDKCTPLNLWTELQWYKTRHDEWHCVVYSS